MEKEFWFNRWQENKIGFHMSKVNPALEKFENKIFLNNSKNDLNVFLPMCGKTLDLIWFSKKVKAVYGVELSKKAILDFFKENNLEYTSHKKR